MKLLHEGPLPPVVRGPKTSLVPHRGLHGEAWIRAGKPVTWSATAGTGRGGPGVRPALFRPMGDRCDFHSVGAPTGGRGFRALPVRRRPSCTHGASGHR